MLHIASDNFIMDPNDEDEDDFDLDSEFEDLDEDWDDEDPFNELDSDISDSEIPGSETPMPTQKTFLQKFFLPIVIVVALVFAVLFVLGQGLLKGDSSQEAPQNQPQEMAQLPTNSDIPEDSGVPDLEPVAQQDDFTDAPLTPLDDMAAATEPRDVLELEDLDLALQDTSPEVAQDNNIPENNFVDSLEQDTPVSMPDTPSMPDDGPLSDFMAEDENMPIPELSENSDILSLKEDTPADNQMPESTMDEELDQSEQANNDTQELADHLISNIQALELEQETLEQKNGELETLISEKTESLDALTNKLKEKEKALQEAEKALKTAQTAKPKVTKAASPSRSSQSPKVSNAPAVNWVLKAALPGKATIAVEGTNDLKQVEIGDTVAKLGTITSIALENGQWVVRGTKGTLFQ